jgi:DNA repair exonuclease SbcCD ATPase subunit
MIVFKKIKWQKIKWQNFLSTGQHPTEVRLDESQTTLIIGSNGAGKSTILDALTFVLYGKSFRKINKAQLINSTNEKACLVEIEFDVNSVQWKIQRGIKPNIFKIYRNDEELDQSASALDQQKWLEQNVLKMNYKSFTQIVILGSSTFVPFMQLPTSARREVVEDLLDIKIFSSMNDVIKGKIRGIRDEVRTLELKKENLKDKVDMQKDFIEKIESQSKDTIKKKTDKIDSLNQEIEKCFKLSFEQEELLEHFKKELKTVDDAQERLREFGSIKGKLSQRIQSIVKEHKFFTENTVCPTCNQDIEELFRVNRISDSQSKAEELREGFEKLQSAIKDEEKDNISYHDFIYSLLKDGGVKAKIIKKYLPLINQQVNKYLQMMDFYINFKLDEEFNETVESPIHEDFSYPSFSEGEKMRIDLALLFTWREIARVKNSVVFDSSLDGFGTDEFLKIIRYTIKDANIFVISHKTGMDDKFENVVRFEKHKGFSRKI